MSKRRRQHENSLKNLRRGSPSVRPKRACTQRCNSAAATTSEVLSDSPEPVEKFATKATSMHVFYGRHNPSPAMATRLDELHEKSVEAQPLILM